MREVEKVWKQIVAINSTHNKAKNIYAKYVSVLRNDLVKAQEIIENKYIIHLYIYIYSNTEFKIDENRDQEKTEINRPSSFLFEENVGVLHLSGSKEHLGRITAVNRGFTKVFEYKRSDILQTSINCLMPELFANVHDELLLHFFKSGRDRIINKQRALHAIKANGYLFPINLVVQQVPSLERGIEYVGMIDKIENDCEYIMTNMNGVIDSISEQISGLMGLKRAPLIFKNNNVNIQIIAPDLIKLFSFRMSKDRIAKYREPGGTELTIIIPKYFSDTFLATKKLKRGKKGKKMHLAQKLKGVSYEKYNQFLNQGNKGKVPLKKNVLLEAPEYIRGEKKLKVRCEIQDLCFMTDNSIYIYIYTIDHKILEIRLFKLVGGSLRQGQDHSESTIRIDVEEKNSFIVEDGDLQKHFQIGSSKEIHIFYSYILSQGAEQIALEEDKDKKKKEGISDSIIKFSSHSDEGSSPESVIGNLGQNLGVNFSYDGLLTHKSSESPLDQTAPPVPTENDEGIGINLDNYQIKGGKEDAADINEELGSELELNSEGGKKEREEWHPRTPMEEEMSEMSLSLDINEEGVRYMFEDKLKEEENTQAKKNPMIYLQPIHKNSSKESSVSQSDVASDELEEDNILQDFETDLYKQKLPGDSERSEPTYTQSEPPYVLEDFYGEREDEERRVSDPHDIFEGEISKEEHKREQIEGGFREDSPISKGIYINLYIYI